MASIIEKIDEDINSSLKNKEPDRTMVLRSLKAALQNATIENKGEIDENQTLATLQREAKKRKEAIELYEKSGRNELANREKKELEVISEYLPKQITDEQLEKIVSESITETGASSIQDMGRVIGAVMSKTKGLADGARVSAVVKEKLAQ